MISLTSSIFKLPSIRFNPLASIGYNPTALSPLQPLLQKRFAVANYRPKKLRFKKSHKGTFSVPIGGSIRGTTVLYGQAGLAAINGTRLKDSQLDAVRTAVRRILKAEKGAKLILRCFPHIPVTQKGLCSRMGKGKGAVEYFATWVSPGKVVLEVQANSQELITRALNTASSMLPLATRHVQRDPNLLVAPRVLPWFLQRRYRENMAQKALSEPRD